MILKENKVTKQIIYSIRIIRYSSDNSKLPLNIILRIIISITIERVFFFNQLVGGSSLASIIVTIDMDEYSMASEIGGELSSVFSVGVFLWS